MANIQHTYRYSSPSSLKSVDSGFCLQLASDLEERADTSFFDGRLLNPLVTAKCLRSVSDLVGTRFYVPPSMLARILREADPVATVTQNHLRFEGFSACCSTYVRHDMAQGCFEAERFRPGTTNVDFGAHMRSELAKVRQTTPLGLVVQQDSVELHQPDSVVVEKKVPLPVRWIKGFAEVQSHCAGMVHKFSLTRVQTQRFLRSLPRAKADHEQWVVPTAQGTRLSVRAAPSAVMVKGTQRLRFLEKLAPLAEQLHVWFNEDQGSSSWILDFGTQSLLMTLNSEPWRGFSGDGSLLSNIATADSAAVAAVKAQLNWQHSLDVAKFAVTTGYSEAEVCRAMGTLAAQGLLGFAHDSATYFHRVLPFDLSIINKLNPRLKSATKLYENRAVTVNHSVGDVTATVASGGVSHQVTIKETDTHCTCPWYAKNQNTRGPCKHVLAVEMALDKPL